MLVAEDRDAAPELAERVRNLFEKPPARIEVLLFVVPRVIAVFADADHAVDGDVVAADGDCLLDRVEQRHAVLFGERPAKILLCELFNVHRGQSERGPCAAVLPPAFEDLADENVGVQSFLVSCRNHGNRLRYWLAGIFRRGCEPNRSDGERSGSSGQPFSSRDWGKFSH